MTPITEMLALFGARAFGPCADRRSPGKRANTCSNSSQYRSAAAIHAAYLQAAPQFFAGCEERGLELRQIPAAARGRLHRSEAARVERTVDQAASRRFAHAF
jgi:hypothetical protein